MAIGNAIKKKIKALKFKLAHYAWDLAFIEYSEEIFYKKDKLRNYHKVKNPYKNKWFADPFILDANEEEIKLLVEEFDYDVNRGRIAKLLIDCKTWSITDCKIILDLPTHLSFPAIYRKDGVIYVHPENSSSGESIIYRYEEMSDALIKYKTILDEPLVDAIFYANDNDTYLISTKAQDANGSILHIYKQAIDNEYVKLPSIIVPNNCARMAGYIINASGGDIRPAQNCSGAYGKEIIFQKVSREGESLTFKNVGALLPPNMCYHGLHTYNVYEKQIVVVDLKKYDYPLIQIIKKLIGK